MNGVSVSVSFSRVFLVVFLLDALKVFLLEKSVRNLSMGLHTYETTRGARAPHLVGRTFLLTCRLFQDNFETLRKSFTIVVLQTSL